MRARLGIVAGAAVSALVGSLLLASPAQAVDYPTWEEVQAAKSNTSDATAAIANIRSLIAGLESEVASAQALSEERGIAYEEAISASFEAGQRAESLSAQAAEGAAEAEAASQAAGQLAAQLYRSTGSDLSVNLFVAGQSDSADQLLSKIGNMSKLVERSSGVYEKANTAKNTAEALGAQADVAEAEREKLKVAAETALAEAQDAQRASEAALDEQERQSIILDEQLKALQDTESKTVADYQAGVAAREAARKAAEEAARAAAAAAASSGSSGGGGSAGVAGSVLPSGWAVPSYGRITGQFGPRASISTGGGSSSSSHRGTDIAGGCGAPIYAANSGTVIYAGPNGTYGNFVLVDHGNGVQTGYAHIRPGGIFVSVGQSVSAGSNIASVGTTGASTGCHLHFEVRLNGTAVNAEPFMSARGATLG